MRLAALLLALFVAPVSIHAITIDTVPVGHPGNADDVQGNFTIGAVDYEFEVGKYEVTNAQYVAFLNGVDPAGTNLRGLYSSSMTNDARGGITFSSGAADGSKYSVKSGRASNPVVFVSFFDAARFTNWLHNGQGAGNTEDGAYTLTGGTPVPTNGDFVARKITASWCLPSADEWYKAAYHKNDSVAASYFDYPTSSDVAPASDQPPGSGAPNQANSANFLLNDNLANGYNDGYAVTASPIQLASTNYLTDVGAYSLADSPYGTFDQGGNAWEWTENSPTLEARHVVGGSWINAASFLAASANNATLAANEANTIGFRVARVTPGLLPGDYNTNGTIDAADYTIWRDTLGSTTDLRANGDDTGLSQNKIDTADYDFWKSSFASAAGTGATGSASVVFVPEPASIVIALASVCTPLLLRRRVSRPSAGVLPWRTSAGSQP